MNATPERWSEQAERAELARLLPAVADPELPPRRHLLLKEHLMDTMTENTRRTARRRTLTLRVALPLGLAAAVAAVALTAVTGHHVAPAPGGTAAGNQPLGGSTDVAYTLQSSSDDYVKLTILDSTNPVDVPRLQRELDRLGVRSHVYAGELGCHARQPEPITDESEAAAKAARGSFQDRVAYFGWEMEQEGQQEVLGIRPSRIPAGLQLFINLPYAKTSPANSSRSLHAGLMKGPGPSCMPGEIYSNPLASLYPTARPTPTPTPTG